MKTIFKRSTLLSILMLLAVAAYTIWANPSRATPASPTLASFLPLAIKGSYNDLSLRGRVTDSDNQPIAQVRVALNNGSTALTDAEGNYQFQGLQEGVYDLTPFKSGYNFSPPSRSLDLPPQTVGQNFLAEESTVVSYVNLLQNGDCEGETGWEFPATVYSADYSSSVVHAGSWGIRTGITNPAENRYSYSSVRQAFSIPSSSPYAMLGMWIYSVSGEAAVSASESASAAGSLPARPAGVFNEDAALASDIQYVLILDANNNVLETLFWERSNAQVWEYVEFDLGKYIGRTIKVHVGSYNDGYGGVTAMYVDDIVVFNGETTGIATPTATAVSGSATPVPGNTCTNYLSNSSFETNAAWEIPATVYSAGYSTLRAYSGTRSMRAGIVSDANRYSYSDARQKVTVPIGANEWTLSLWLFPQSIATAQASGQARDQIESADTFPVQPLAENIESAALTGDLQYVLILDANQVWIDTLVWQRSDARQWLYYQFDLHEYAGRTIYFQFGVYNDGWGTLTAMYVDDMALTLCSGPTNTPTVTPTPTQSLTPTTTPTPTVTPSPTSTFTPSLTPSPTITPSPTVTLTPMPANCQNQLFNSGFEKRTDWDIPVTAYSAGYSDSKAYMGFWSMRSGIVSAGDNRYSYSDAGQFVTLPSGITRADLEMMIYPMSSEPAGKAIPPMPSARQRLPDYMVGDVQYVLILDANEVMLEAVYWDRTNSAQWALKTMDLKSHAGQTIKIQFGVYNDGADGVTSMYVDQAALVVCR